MTKQNIVISTGGTGGHIFPAEALAEKLIKKHNITLVCDDRGEKYLAGVFEKVEKIIIKESRLAGGLAQKLMSLNCIIIDMVKLIFVFMKIKPKVVIGFGGYSSFPAICAATILHIPVVLHEQNAVMGRVNRLMCRFVRKVAISFPETLNIPEGSDDKIVHTGNPVRKKIFSLTKQNKSRRKKILVIGGSQGSAMFSEVVPEAIKLLPEEYRDKILLVQQAREELVEETRGKYLEIGVSHKVESFYDNMGELLADCDFVIARSGASTVAEIAAVGKPSILIPLASAKDNHQYYNAKYMVDKGAAVLLEESELNAEKLKSALLDLLSKESSLSVISQRLSKKNTVDNLERLVCSIVYS